MQDRLPAAGGGLREAYDLADSALDPGTTDRPLDTDLVAAQGVLDGFAMMYARTEAVERETRTT
jgi:hypothetical protein